MDSDSASATTSTLDNPIDHASELDNEKLYQRINDSMRENEILQAETMMFEKYLKRIDPKDLGFGLLLMQGTPGSSQSSSVQDSSSRPLGRSKRNRSKGSYADRTLRLTIDQKCEIAQREIEELKDEQTKSIVDLERILDNHKALLEENDLQLAEVDKATYEFDRDIKKRFFASQIPGERILRFIEERIKAMDTLMEKLRLKNSTLRSQKKRLDQQLKQKEEMGEVLHQVDFEQLKIENQQYLEKIEEKNGDLLRLKMMAGNTMQVLNRQKKKLSLMTQEATRLRTEIGSRVDILSRIDAETDNVDQEKQKANSINERLKQQLADFKVPEVLEYVQEKQELGELRQKVKTWERKVDISEMALKTHRKTWRRLQEQSENIQHIKWPLET